MLERARERDPQALSRSLETTLGRRAIAHPRLRVVTHPGLRAIAHAPPPSAATSAPYSDRRASPVSFATRRAASPTV